MIEKFLRIAGRPKSFSGNVRLPPSKSYLHRGLFVSAIASSESRIVNCGRTLNDDAEASIAALSSLGARIAQTKISGGAFKITPGWETAPDVRLDARGSGTTARFLIPFAALSKTGTRVTILGNESLSTRPMESIFEPLSKLGVRCVSLNGDGKLPIAVEGGGIRGGSAEIDGSVSSQFVSSLLISCAKAENDTSLSISDPKSLVSKPYIEATLKVLEWFGFKIKSERTKTGEFSAFKIKGNQSVRGREFKIPGDMSSAAALIGAAISARGKIRISNANFKNFPQSDSAMVGISREFGARAKLDGPVVSIKRSNLNMSDSLTLDLGDSPDLVPIVAGVAASTGRSVHISNIGHLRFKESDRIGTLSRELSKIGVSTAETKSSLTVMNANLKRESEETMIDPAKDHRMLMALTIAGLSGRFGTLLIQDPDCVQKSYPSFVSDIQKLCHEKSTVRIVRLREKAKVKN